MITIEEIVLWGIRMQDPVYTVDQLPHLMEIAQSSNLILHGNTLRQVGVHAEIHHDNTLVRKGILLRILTHQERTKIGEVLHLIGGIERQATHQP